MCKKKSILVAVILFLVGASVGGCLWWNWQSSQKYSVVYLISGDMYVGKLSHLCGLRLSDAYLLQGVKNETDPAQGGFQLMPLKDSLWSPKTIRINPRQVIFTAYVGEGSKISEALKEGK